VFPELTLEEGESVAGGAGQLRKNLQPITCIRRMGATCLTDEQYLRKKNPTAGSMEDSEKFAVEAGLRRA